MRRKRTVNDLNTTQVARVLGISKKTLYRMLQDGRIPEPPRTERNYRIWSAQEVEIIRQELGK
jgi:excisionase family DNA binding protein